MTIYGKSDAILGHRGAGKGTHGGYVENTAASLAHAIQQGAVGVEIDVQVSADDELVVYHDAWLADGTLVREHPAAHLRSLGIERFSTTIAPLTSSELLNIELKSGYDQQAPPDPRLVPSVIAALETGVPPQVVVSGFDPAEVRLFAQLIADIPAALLTAPLEVRERTPMPLSAAIMLAKQCGVAALHANTYQFTVDDVDIAREEIALVHNAGLELLVWCPEPAESVILHAAGVDAVCVNDVPATVAAYRTG